MASIQQHSCPTKVLLLYLFLVFLTSTFISAVYSQNQVQQKSYELFGRKRMLLEIQEDDEQDEPIMIKKKSTTTNSSTKLSNKNQTKLIKPTTTSASSKNQTKLIKTTSSAFKNQTKLIKLPSSSDNSSKNNKTKLIKPSSDSIKSQFKKLNYTSKSSSNSTSLLTKKSSDLPKNKTTKPTTTKETKAQLEKELINPKSKSSDKAQPKKAQKQPSWIDDDDNEDDDFVSEFRDLPSKFQETFVPDLEMISQTSRVYLTKYNKEFTKGFKPYVGNKYAHTIASITSFAFIIIPLIFVSLLFNKIKAYFSLQKLLIFIQVYLAIYFTILCLSSLVTGLEPLKFFYSTSQSTYVCVQVFQTLAYVLYLLLLLMYLVLVFSTETGLATKLLGLGQTFVGFAVGLHYYMTVFHRAVLHQPPKSSWKVHALYATCFLAICLLGTVDRRKKAYLEEGGEEGKKS